MEQRTEQPDLDLLLAPHARTAEADLQQWLVEPDVPDSLAEVLRYCALGAGKRLRPALVHLSAQALSADPTAEGVRRAAVAVEMVHCYSLVHDDLPCMDDDTLRRGQPTAHVQFGEAMALLAGDALLTRAMGVLAQADHPRAAEMVAELAAAAGPAGMIAGQVGDMELCDLPIGLEGVEYIHLRKTAALIRAATRMGGLAADGPADAVDALGEFGQLLGLAFQLFDDLLDVTADANTLGKTPGKDKKTGKRTYVAEMPPRQVRQRGDDLTQRAIACLEPLGQPAEPLAQLARGLVGRSR